MNEYKIIVDAGHGGMDPGAVSGDLKEKDYNLRAAQYMYNRFKELNIPVAITRNSDENLSRSERLDIMNNTFGNTPNVIILSNHINAGGGEGAEVVYPLRTSSTLPRAILDEIGANGQIKRKVYQRVLPENPSKDYYYIMRETPNTTALLIEYGFIDNKADQQKLNDNLLDYVEGVVKAVSEYIGVPYENIENDMENAYTVKSGDTLYSIALKNNTTVDEIKNLNNLTSNTLSIGQRLLIPSTSIEEEYDLYTVMPNDTLYSIANQFGTTVNDIIDYNNLETTVLTINQILKVPKQDIMEDEIVYTVKLGDTLYSIAEINNVSVNELKTLNNLTNNILSIGQELLIPKKDIEEIDYYTYNIKSGDTLYKIAQEYNTTVDAIKAYNNLPNDILTINDTIQIPINNITTEYRLYKVSQGDTLYSIASKYNTSVDSIKELNALDGNLLQVGQNLKIPI